MIFGFNTDIKHGDTVFHVQSEARETDRLLQTQVFVRGRCIGKRATPYADQRNNAEFTDQKKEQTLREQHRLVLDAIRDGRLEEVFDKKDTPETLAAIKELDLEWLPSDAIHSLGKLSMKLRATEAGRGIAGAQLTVRLTRPQVEPAYAQVVTGDAGEAEVTFEVEEDSLADCSVLAQMNLQGRTATRKFQLRRAAQ